MPTSASAPTGRGGKFYHVRVRPGQVGAYALLPGDPDRVEIIARFLKNVQYLSAHREFRVANGYLRDTLVTVCSTGIGAPATAIALEELARAGVRTFIRVGTCGGIQPEIALGELVVASGAVRLEGTSRQYVRAEYPAVATPRVVAALTTAAGRLGHTAHEGIVASTDSFYVGQSRPGLRGFTSAEGMGLLGEMRRARVLCFEMEAAALFTLATLYGLEAGAVLAVVANRIKDTFAVRGVEAAAQTAVAAVGRLAKAAGKSVTSGGEPLGARRPRARPQGSLGAPLAP
jgi:uridine phosphorylase